MRPNILWYCTDQQRFDTIGAFGYPHAHTPNLDRFVESGVSFTRTYCQSPICTPSRASFLTGMYPSAVRVNGNFNRYFPSGPKLLPRLFADAGYATGLVGKLHLAHPHGGVEQRVDDGYQYFRYSPAAVDNWPAGQHHYADWLREKGRDPRSVLGRRDSPSYAERFKNPKFGGLFEPAPERDNVPPGLHQTTWCTEMAIEFLRMQSPERPWLLSVNPIDPHPPFDPPWEYYRRFDPKEMPAPLLGRSDLERQACLAAAGVDFQSAPRKMDEDEAGRVVAAYYAMIEQIDDQFGRLLAELEASGQAEHTIVVFTSDHGESLGDHGLLLKGCRFYEGLTRVPLVWRWPGRFEAGLRVDDLTELTDIAPTLLEATGVEGPEEMQGRSLMKLLGGERPDAHRDHVRSEYYNALPLPHGTHATMFRDLRWKLVTYHGLEVGELYDLDNDPDEFENLWGSAPHAETRNALIQRSFDATVRANGWGPPRVGSR